MSILSENQDVLLGANTYGIYGNSMFNRYVTDMNSMPGTQICCEQINQGGGIDIALGFTYSHYFANNLILEARAGYMGLSGGFSELRDYDIQVSNRLEKGQVNHIIDVTLGGVNLDLMIGYEFYRNFSTFFSFGYITWLNNSFAQSERIVKPDDRGTFENNRRVRNEDSGKILNLYNGNFTTSFGIRYQTSVNKEKTLVLIPELYLSTILGSVLSSDNWNIYSLRLGFSFVYRPAGDLSTPIMPAN